MSDATGIFLFGAIVVLVALGAFATVYDALEWDRFKIAHNCKVIGEISGSTSVGVGISSNGSPSVVPVYTPGKTGYACDDGKQYWR